MLLDRLKRIKKRVEKRLEIAGIKQPVLELEIPYDVVKIVREHNPDLEKAIEELMKSEWVKEFCRARCLPKEYLKYTDEELEKLAEENKIPKEIVEIYKNCKYNLASRIVEKHGKRR